MCVSNKLQMYEKKSKYTPLPEKKVFPMRSRPTFPCPFSPLQPSNENQQVADEKQHINICV